MFVTDSRISSLRAREYLLFVKKKKKTFCPRIPSVAVVVVLKCGIFRKVNSKCGPRISHRRDWTWRAAPPRSSLYFNIKIVLQYNACKKCVFGWVFVRSERRRRVCYTRKRNVPRKYRKRFNKLRQKKRKRNRLTGTTRTSLPATKAALQRCTWDTK